MGVRRAHEGGIGLPRHRDIVGVIAGSAHEPQILKARHGTPDEGAASMGCRNAVVVRHWLPPRHRGPSARRSAYPSTHAVANWPRPSFMIGAALCAIVPRWAGDPARARRAAAERSRSRRRGTLFHEIGIARSRSMGGIA